MHPARRDGAGIAAATASFVAVFAAGAVPIPLYDRYRAQNAITATGLALAALAYFVLAVGALLILGRLSDHFGRSPVAVAALAAAALESLTFLALHSRPNW